MGRVRLRCLVLRSPRLQNYRRLPRLLSFLVEKHHARYPAQG
jgi:hypothetical protein